MKKRNSVILIGLLVCYSFLLSGLSDAADPYEVKGDINGDKQINLQEAIYALQVVAGVNVQPGNVSETEPNNSLAEANQIGIGYSNPIINASLESDTDVDYYKFTTNGNYFYVIETYDILANNAKCATGIFLFDANNKELMNDGRGANGSNNVNARMWTKPTAGTYYILVRRANYCDWTGNYSLRILPKHDEPGAEWDAEKDYEPNDSLELGNHIEVGLRNAQTHQLTQESWNYETDNRDQDWYHFTAGAGRTYTIETFDILANTSKCATGIFLFDANVQELAKDSSGNNGTNNVNASITRTFPLPGTYYILVRKADYCDWTGNYSLRILPKYDEPGAEWNSEKDNEPNDKLVLANQIEVGLNKAQTHQLTPESSNYETNNTDHDWYHFNAEAGGTYVIETFDILPNSSDCATGIYLCDANGQELANDRSGYNGTGNVDASITRTLPAAGNYYVLVVHASYCNWAGTYSLRVIKQ